jgi:hypothetical protein
VIISIEILFSNGNFNVFLDLSIIAMVFIFIFFMVFGQGLNQDYNHIILYGKHIFSLLYYFIDVKKYLVSKRMLVDCAVQMWMKVVLFSCV